MEAKNLIPVEVLCSNYEIEVSFISSLHEIGLVDVTTAEGGQYIAEEQISDIERIMRLHYDLELNLDSLDVVIHLLEQVRGLQKEITALKNRISLYEG